MQSASIVVIMLLSIAVCQRVLYEYLTHCVYTVIKTEQLLSDDCPTDAIQIQIFYLFLSVYTFVCTCACVVFLSMTL